MGAKQKHCKKKSQTSKIVSLLVRNLSKLVIKSYAYAHAATTTTIHYWDKEYKNGWQVKMGWDGQNTHTFATTTKTHTHKKCVKPNNNNCVRLTITLLQSRAIFLVVPYSKFELYSRFRHLYLDHSNSTLLKQNKCKENPNTSFAVRA